MRHVLAILLGFAGVIPASGFAETGSATLSVSARVVPSVGVRVSPGGEGVASGGLGVRSIALPDGRVVTASLGSSDGAAPAVTVQRFAATASGPAMVVVTVLADGGPGGSAAAAGLVSGATPVAAAGR
jgi:hypothetical protein